MGDGAYYVLYGIAVVGVGGFLFVLINKLLFGAAIRKVSRSRCSQCQCTFGMSSAREAWRLNCQERMALMHQGINPNPFPLWEVVCPSCGWVSYYSYEHWEFVDKASDCTDSPGPPTSGNSE